MAKNNIAKRANERKRLDQQQAAEREQIAFEASEDEANAEVGVEESSEPSPINPEQVDSD